MIHLVTYVAFFIMVHMYYGLPIHLMHDLFRTFRNFRRRLTRFLQYQKVISQLDALPDATEEDLVSW